MSLSFGESVMSAFFMMIVVFVVLIILWALIRLFTGIIASMSGGSLAKLLAKRRR